MRSQRRGQGGKEGRECNNPGRTAVFVLRFTYGEN